MSSTQFCYLSVSYYSSSYGEEEEGLGQIKFTAIIMYKKLNGKQKEDTDYHCLLLLQHIKRIHEKVQMLFHLILPHHFEVGNIPILPVKKPEAQRFKFRSKLYYH